jgi:hypothetical protein
MSDFPTLPSGPLGVLSLAASAGLSAMVIALGLCLVQRRWAEALWAVAPLVALLATIEAGLRNPAAHSTWSAVALVLVVRNAVVLRGSQQIASIVATAGVCVSVVVAVVLFR